ncbi:class II aldolase/adducin family protein [Candidatus Bathyarchaeota archaeon]|jgi:L-ribulose-5-phosphate 4-epimerase|nr:class II aldolase/adducin family protein [Candidatus Bathyarchaeota archaeon]
MTRSDKKVLQDLKREVIETAKTVFEENLVKLTFGVVSARIPDTDHVVITPSGFSKARLNTKELIVLDLEANLVEGKLRPSVESKTHCYIHKLRPDVGAVIHTHSPVASGFASANAEIPCVSTEQAFVLGGTVPVVERYVMPGSENQSDLEIIEKTFRSSKAVLLRNHGILVIGANLREALNNAIVVEDAARIALVAKLVGTSEKLSDGEIKNLVDFRARYGQRKK